MARIDEVAADVYRVSIYLPQFDLQFNHFLIKDDEPLLFHTGMRRMFPEVREAVALRDCVLGQGTPSGHSGRLEARP